MRSKLADLFTDIARNAKAFGEPVLAQLCRMAAIEAEYATVPWNPNLKSGILGIWDWDVANDLNHLDPTGAELFGVSPAKASKGLPNRSYLSAIHPDDIDTVSRALTKSLKGGVYEAEYRIIAHGQARRVFAKGFCTVDRSNRPVRFPGALMALDLPA